MNTIQSTWIGWGSLIIAGGGAYYFAKRSVNADKRTRFEEEVKRRRLRDTLDAEFASKAPLPKKKHRQVQDDAAGTSADASQDPASIAGVAETKNVEEIPYIAKKPYRAPKGDRFS